MSAGSLGCHPPEAQLVWYHTGGSAFASLATTSRCHGTHAMNPQSFEAPWRLGRTHQAFCVLLNCHVMEGHCSSAVTLHSRPWPLSWLDRRFSGWC
eukprot:4688051-Amphidinium_carterae.1